MEDVLEVYHLPYDPDYPVVCMDESSKQLIGEVHTPIPCKPGQPKRMDDEYVRHGVAEIFMEVEPLAGRRHVAITERRTRKDWAQQIKQMLDGTVDIHHTPKHGSWLNMAEIELSVLKGQCLNRRIAKMARPCKLRSRPGKVTATAARRKLIGSLQRRTPESS
jgi:hypothetical protein